jgi:hypothetical protein
VVTAKKQDGGKDHHTHQFRCRRSQVTAKTNLVFGRYQFIVDAKKPVPQQRFRIECLDHPETT